MKKVVTTTTRDFFRKQFVPAIAQTFDVIVYSVNPYTDNQNRSFVQFVVKDINSENYYKFSSYAETEQNEDFIADEILNAFEINGHFTSFSDVLAAVPKDVVCELVVTTTISDDGKTYTNCHLKKKG